MSGRPTTRRLPHRPGTGTAGPGGTTVQVRAQELVYVGSWFIARDTAGDATYAARVAAVNAHEAMSSRTVSGIVDYSPNTASTVMSALWLSRVAQYLTEHPGQTAELTVQFILDEITKGGSKLWAANTAFVSGDKIINVADQHLYTASAAFTSGATFATSGTTPSAWTLADNGLARENPAYFSGDIGYAGSDDTSINFDAAFAARAQRLVAAGLATVAIRPAHEPYGPWERWALGANTRLGNPFAANSDGGAAQWYAAARRMFTAYRANGHTGPWILNLETYPPGARASVYQVAALDDAAVAAGLPRVFTRVGPDTYDESSAYKAAAYTGGTQPERLAIQKQVWAANQLPGLNAIAQWARVRNLKVRICEFNIWNRDDGAAGGDNAYFITQMFSWLRANADVVESASNFDFTDSGNADHRLYTTAGGTATSFPLAAAAYKVGVNTWLNGSTPPTVEQSSDAGTTPAAVLSFAAGSWSTTATSWS